MQRKTINTIVTIYNQALRDFNAQLQTDGWAGDVADGFSKIWNNEFYGNEHGNTADLVRKDLNTFKKQLDELKAARKEGDSKFKTKFKEIFGVEYNKTNMLAYEQAEARYIPAAKAHAQEENFKSQFGLLLSSGLLQEETATMIVDDQVINQTMATKKDVFAREEKKFISILGEAGKEILNKKYEEAKANTVEEKYKVLHQLAQAINTNLHENTMKATGGASFASVKKHYNNCYKAAFGVDNDIMKRITDYNTSQQVGTGIVKGATVAGIVIACSLTGQVQGIVAVAGVSAGATAAVEVTDAATQKRNIDALRNNGLKAYLESVGKNTDWAGIAKASLSSGAMMLAIGGASIPIAHLCRISASAAGLTGKALDIATGIGTNAAVTGGVIGSEYLMKGEITVEGTVFAVIMAVVGSTIQVVQINKMYAAQEAAAQEAHIQNIQDARRTLGFEDGVEITPEMLKKQYYKLAKEIHSDHGGSDVEMAIINSSHDYLEAHMADINITITGAKPATINPTVEAAKGNVTPQNTSATANKQL